MPFRTLFYCGTMYPFCTTNRHRRPYRDLFAVGLCLLLLTVLLLTVLLPATVALAKAKETENDGPPEPITVTRTTRDGVELSIRYFPGTEDENTIPIMIIHDWNEEGSDYEEVARFLQSQGYAVAVPDLRGHGNSTQRVNTRSGKSENLVPEKLRSRDMINIIRNDLEETKRFLLQENNEKKLNLQKLCIIGIGRGSLFALNYAVKDWSHKDLVGFKQGKDIKAIVLISPVLSSRGLSAKNAVEHAAFEGHISMLIVAGNNKSALKNAKYIYNRLKNPLTVNDNDISKSTLFLKEKDTKLKGHKLLTEPELNTQEIVNAFIELRLRKSTNIPWEERTRPGQ